MALPSAQAAPQDEPAQKSDETQKKDESKKEDEKDAKPKISYDVDKLQELQLPPRAIQELSKGTRSKRDPDKSLQVQRSLDMPRPSGAEIKKFDDLRRIGGPDYKQEDLPIIEANIKWQVYSMSAPGAYANNAIGKKNRDQIENVLDNPASVNPNFLPIYKDTLARFLPDLLELHLWPRVNAMRLLAKMRDEKMIPLFVANIRDEQQHDGVKYWAVKGIQYLGERRLIRTVDLESEAVAALLDKLEEIKEVDPFTRRILQQSIVQALGAVGRPTRIAFKQDAAVAIALLHILRDPNLRRWERVEAAVALSNLQIPRDLDYNFQYVAYEISQLAADISAAALKDPAIDDMRSHWLLVEISEALDGQTKKDPLTRLDRLSLAERARQHPLASPNGDSAYIRALGEPIHKMAATALKVFKSGDPKADDLAKINRVQAELPKSGFPEQLQQFTALLQKQQPRSMKLTPKSDELGPPPSLVGPATRTPETPAEEKPETTTEQTASGPGPS